MYKLLSLVLLADPAVVVVGDAPAEADARAPTAFVEVLEPDAQPGAPGELADVLEEATGVHLRRVGGAGRAQYLQIRGAGAHQLAVFLDELPVVTGRGGAFDLSSLPPSYVERVEVLRGPAAAAYGSGAQGGALHLRTREVAPGRHARMRGAVGTGDLGRLDLSQAVGGARWDVLGVGSASAADGDFRYEDVNGAIRRRANNDHQRFNGLLRGRLDLGEAGEVGALFEGAALDRGEPGPEPHPRLESRSQLRRFQGAVRWASAPGPLEGSVRLHGFHREFRFEDPAPPFGGAEGALLTDRLLSARAELAWTDAEGHRPTLAVEGRYDQALTEGERPLEAERGQMAIVLGETWRPAPGVQVLALLRIDDTTERGALLVPHAGAQLGPVKGLSLAGNVGRVFRDPSFDELYFVGPGIEGDPTLRPEDGLAWDLGLTWRLGTRLRLEVVYFDQRYDRLILFVPLDAYRVRASDAFGARVRGVESSARLRLGRLHLALTHTWLDHAFDDALRAPLPHRPEHRVFGRAAWFVQRAEIYTEVEARTELHTDRFGHRAVPGHALWDLGMAGPLAPGWRVGVEFENLLDARAVDAVREPRPGRTVLGWISSRVYAP